MHVTRASDVDTDPYTSHDIYTQFWFRKSVHTDWGSRMYKCTTTTVYTRVDRGHI